MPLQDREERFSRKRNPVIGMVMDFRASRPSCVDPRSFLRSLHIVNWRCSYHRGHHLAKNPACASVRINDLSYCHTSSHPHGLLVFHHWFDIPVSSIQTIFAVHLVCWIRNLRFTSFLNLISYFFSLRMWMLSLTILRIIKWLRRNFIGIL